MLCRALSLSAGAASGRDFAPLPPSAENLLLQAAGLLLYKHLCCLQAPPLRGTDPKKSYPRLKSHRLWGGGRHGSPPAAASFQRSRKHQSSNQCPCNTCAQEGGLGSGAQCAHHQEPHSAHLSEPPWTGLHHCQPLGFLQSCRFSCPSALQLQRSLSAFWFHRDYGRQAFWTLRS